MSLQERTLVVKNFDPEKTTQKLLKELCLQAGPVKNVIMRQDHAFVEFEDVESVGFSKALLDGICLHGKKLFLEPKLKTEEYYRYTKLLQDYIRYDKQQRALQEHSRIQPFQQNHISGPRVWYPNSSGMNVYPPQQLLTPTQFVLPSRPQQLPMPIVSTIPAYQNLPQMQMSYIQTNGYIQPTNYVNPVVSQHPVNFTHNQVNNNIRQFKAPIGQNNSGPWFNRRR